MLNKHFFESGDERDLTYFHINLEILLFPYSWDKKINSDRTHTCTNQIANHAWNKKASTQG